MNFNNEQFKLGRLFAFMDNLSCEHYGYEVDFDEWIEKSMEEQRNLQVNINDEMLKELIGLYTSEFEEIIYERRLYLILYDKIIYVNDGYITIADDYETTMTIINNEIEDEDVNVMDD